MILCRAEDSGRYYLGALWLCGLWKTIVHGLCDTDLECLWVWWTNCIPIKLSDLLRFRRPANKWRKSLARRMFYNDARMPPLVADDCQPWSACQRACRPVVVIMYSMKGWRTKPLEKVGKRTQAKKRHMLIVPSTTSRNYVDIDINWWEGHIHNLQRHRFPNLSWEFWRLAKHFKSKGFPFHPFKLQHEIRFP